MIWLRRGFAVILVPLFIILFLVAFLLIRVNSTVLSADFYVKQLQRADIFNFLYDDVAPAALKEANKDPKDIPINVEKVGNKGVSLVREVLPPEWLEEQTEQVIVQVVPYLEGSQEKFEVVVPLKDRIQAAVPGVKKLMRDEDVYKQLFDQVIVKLVKDNLEQATQLPLGITLTDDDVVPALRQVLPPEFLQSQAENMIDQVAPYVTGEAQGFKIVVPLADRKQAALVAIQQLVDKKLNEAVAKMRPCTVKEALDLVQKGFTGSLPSCLPKGFTLEQIKQALGINIPGITQQQIEQQLGISLNALINGVTADTIKNDFKIDVAGQVNKAIGDAIPNEFVFTDADLRNVLSDNDEETLDNILDVTRNGAKFTDADLRKAISDSQGGAQALKNLDDVRRYMGLERKLRVLLYLVPLLFLTAIAYLGGRCWRSRLAWAAVPLLLAAGIAYAASGPVYSAIVQPMLDDAFADAVKDATGVGLLMIEKGTSVAQAAINDVVSPLATQALVLLIISVVALALVIVWPMLFRRPKAEAPQP